MCVGTLVRLDSDIRMLGPLNQHPLLVESIHLVLLINLIIFIDSDVCINQYLDIVHR